MFGYLFINCNADAVLKSTSASMLRKGTNFAVRLPGEHANVNFVLELAMNIIFSTTTSILEVKRACSAPCLTIHLSTYFAYPVHWWFSHNVIYLWNIEHACQ